MKIREKILTASIGIVSCGCIKPLQPPPSEINFWMKPAVERKDILSQMLSCGYPSAGGFIGPAGLRYEVIDEVRAEKCMLDSGYKYKDGSRGKCSIPNDEIQKACKELEKH